MGFHESLNAYCDVAEVVMRAYKPGRGYWFVCPSSQWARKPRLRYRYWRHDGKAVG